MTRYLEIFGQSVTTPDSDSVASLSARYSGLCTTIADAKDGLGSIGSPQATAQWVGLAADTFASKLGNLPGQLEQAWQSYDAVARALSGYASSLRPVVSALYSLAAQAEEAEGTLSATLAARDQAIRQGDPSANTVWNAKVSEAQAAVSQLKRRQSALLAELRSCSSECVRQVQQAAHEGIHNGLITDLRHDLTDIGRVLWLADPLLGFGFTALTDPGFDLTVGKDLLTVGKDLFLDPFVSLYKAYAAYWQSQSWVNLGACLDAISGVLAIAALVCTPFPPVAGALLLLSMGFGALGFVADLTAELKHEQHASWTQVGFDVASLSLMGAGRLIGQGLKFADGPEAEDLSKSLWKTGFSHFRDLRDPAPVDIPHDTTPAGLGKHVLAAYRDSINSYLNVGVDGSGSPAAVPYEHVEWGIDRAGDGVTVLNDQTQQDGGP